MKRKSLLTPTLCPVFTYYKKRKAENEFQHKWVTLIKFVVFQKEMVYHTYTGAQKQTQKTKQKTTKTVIYRPVWYII